MVARSFKAFASIASPLVLVVAGTWTSSPRVRAAGDGNNDESRIQQGFRIATVPLNLAGKNRVGGTGKLPGERCRRLQCCHGIGPPFLTAFLPGHNPYQGQSKMINPATSCPPAPSPLHNDCNRSRS